MASLVIAFLLYYPALRGDFVLDDIPAAGEDKRQPGPRVAPELSNRKSAHSLVPGCRTS
jgi:hypothetical protein